VTRSATKYIRCCVNFVELQTLSEHYETQNPHEY